MSDHETEEENETNATRKAGNRVKTAILLWIWMQCASDFDQIFRFINENLNQS